MRIRAPIAALAFSTLAAHAPAANLQTVALSTDVPGEVLSGLEHPALNNSGEVIFRNGDSVFTWSGGNTQWVLHRLTTTVPGTSYLMRGLWNATLADTGDISLQIATTKTAGLSYANAVLVIKNNGPLTMVAMDGDAAPALSGVTLTTQNITFSNNGVMGLYSTLSGAGVSSSNNKALWIATSAADITLLARTGTTPPSRSNVTWTDMTGFIGPPFMAADGTGFFSGTVAGTGINTGNNEGTYFGTNSSNVQHAMVEGTAVPGMTGVSVRSLRTLSVNQLQHIAQECSTSTSNYSVILTNRSGSLQTFAATGQVAPGLSGLVYGAAMDKWQPLINSRDHIAFGSELVASVGSASVGTAFFAETDSGLNMVFKLGDAAPGAPDGVTISSVALAYEYNGLDQLLFSATLSNGGQALYLWNPDQTFTTLAMTGEHVTVRGGVDKIYSTFDFAPYTTSGQDGLPRGLNESGQVVFHAVFTDGTGAVLFYGVPEPASLVVLGFGASALLLRRKPVRRG